MALQSAIELVKNLISCKKQQIEQILTAQMPGVAKVGFAQ